MYDSGAFESIPGQRSLSDLVFKKLQDAIIDGRLEPGQWLRQEALAQEMGVSQMPVREALKQLAAEGLAERIPYKGVRVTKFSWEDIVDICTIRLVLESLAARLAAPLITEQELERLKENLNRAEECKEQEQMTLRRQLNAEFHLSFCQASGRRYLLRQIESVWAWFPSVMLYEGVARRQKELLMLRLERENCEHRAILAALEKHDPEQAAEEARRHIRNLSQELTQVLGIPEKVVEFLKSL